MRNPNGYGSVVKLSGNRRRPYMARITTGFKDNGQPIYHALDYFAKREDALIALAEYNNEQYNIDYRNITFSRLYELLVQMVFPSLSNALQGTLKAARGHCSKLDAVRYRNIKKYQMQSCIDSCGLSYATQTNIRNLFYHMDRLAFDLDIINKRNSETLTVSSKTPERKRIFTDDEVCKVWAKRGELVYDQIIFLLFTGCRRSEMLLMKSADVDLKAGTMVGGVKTAAGKGRVIPIHSQLRPIVERYCGKSEYLFPMPIRTSRNMDDARKSAFALSFDAAMDALGIDHTSHDCRHTVRSKLDSAGGNKVAIDRIMGHASEGTGEKVYTHKSVDELSRTMELLTYKGLSEPVR